MLILLLYSVFVVCSIRQMNEKQYEDVEIEKQILYNSLLFDLFDSSYSNSNTNDNKNHNNDVSFVNHQDVYLQNLTNTACGSKSNDHRDLDNSINPNKLDNDPSSTRSSKLFFKPQNHSLTKSNDNFFEYKLSVDDILKYEEPNNFLKGINNANNETEAQKDINTYNEASHMFNMKLNTEEQSDSNKINDLNVINLVNNNTLVEIYNDNDLELFIENICKNKSNNPEQEIKRDISFKMEPEYINFFQNRKTLQINEKNKNDFLNKIYEDEYQYFTVEFRADVSNIYNLCLYSILAIFLKDIPNFNNKKLSIKPEFLYITLKKPDFLPFIYYFKKCINYNSNVDLNLFLTKYHIILRNIHFMRLELTLFLGKQANLIELKSSAKTININNILNYCQNIIYQILYYLLNQKKLAESYLTLNKKCFRTRTEIGLLGYEKNNIYLFTFFLINDPINLLIDFNKGNSYSREINLTHVIATFITEFCKLINVIELDDESKEKILKIIPDPNFIKNNNGKIEYYDSNFTEMIETFYGIEKMNEIYETFMNIFFKNLIIRQS